MTRRYRHLPSLDLVHGAFALRCVEDDDIEPIRQWRNAQMEVLRQTEAISPEAQRAYFDRAIWPQMELEKPETILVTVLRDGEMIGYGGLVHCAWEHARAEISILFSPAIVAQDREYWGCLMAFLAMIEEIAFDRLRFNRLTLETYAIRDFHIGVLEDAGYVLEGRLREHVWIAGEPADSLLHAKLASDQAFSG